MEPSVKVKKPRARNRIYDLSDVINYVREVTGIDVSDYIDEEATNHCHFRGSVHLLVPGDNLDDNSPAEQKALHKCFGMELSVIIE